MERGEESRRRSFEQLFRDTRTDLLAYVLRRADTAEDAADVLAETYLIAWKKLDGIPGGVQMRPWLFGVARNLLLKGTTRRRSYSVLVERLANELRAHRPERSSVAEGEEHEALRMAPARLPEIDREILTLSAWEGLTASEVAGVVGKSANTVRVRLHRARARLRRELGRPKLSEGSGEHAAIRYKLGPGGQDVLRAGPPLDGIGRG
jgi:RNA polymerase sigma factor (sigma-70 family)